MRQRSLYRKKKRRIRYACLATLLFAFGSWIAFQGSEETPTEFATTVALPALAEVETTNVSETPSIRTVDMVIKAGDTLGKRLQLLGVSSDTVSTLLSNQTARPVLTKIYPGQRLTLAFNDEDELISLEQIVSETEKLLVQKRGDSFLSEMVETPVTTQVKYAFGVIEDSLFLAAQKSGLNSNLILELANIFEYDIDFALDIRPNDRFALLYEERSIDGKVISPGRILAAEFVNQDRSYEAVYFEDAQGNGGYYTPDGKALQKAFLRSPVKFSRISSHFNPSRKHPILHTVRAHKGVDYAAPTGTPVKASGDGKVIFVGRKSGYGNCVILQHGKEYTTLYAHLSRFASGLRTGKTIEQSQTIGYVGMTGLATAPHLHYEFRINGVHQNPLTVKLTSAQPIDSRYRSAYLTHSQSLLTQMRQQSMLAMAKINAQDTTYE